MVAIAATMPIAIPILSATDRSCWGGGEPLWSGTALDVVEP